MRIPRSLILNLFTKTFKVTILTADKFHNDLTLQFGLLADYYKNENEYLNVVHRFKINSLFKMIWFKPSLVNPKQLILITN